MQETLFFATKNGQLYLGDCLELLPRIPSNSVDMILCDLPYGTTAFAWDKKLPLGRLWKEYTRIIKEHGATVLTAQQVFATDLICAGRKYFRYELIWEKGLAVGFLNAHRMPLRAHENILIFYKKLPVYHPQITKGRPYVKKDSGVMSIYGKTEKHLPGENSGQRYPRSVLRFASANGKHGHPTEKPLALFEWLIRTYTDEGGMVLDNCAGSGTTAVAAEKLNRRWLAMEKEREYCEIAKRRLEGLGKDDGN
jgi:site-specific DNA-methyltransferase (adenine-specific)